MSNSHELTVELKVVHNMTDGTRWFSFGCRCWVFASRLYRLDKLSPLRTLLKLTDIEMVS